MFRFFCKPSRQGGLIAALQRGFMQPFQYDRQKTSDGNAILTVLAPRVEAGRVMVVKSLAATHDNIATTESIRFRMTNGARVVNIYEGVPPVADGLVTWQGEVPIPDTFWVEAYYPNAANTEVMHLDLSGVYCLANDYWSRLF